MSQTVDGNTTDFALDIAGGLPEVIYTSEGNVYLHLPGVIVAESAAGETRHLLSDGLGSVRQGVDKNGAIITYNEFDPYGNPVEGGGEPYGFTGEWWQAEVGLLHLRARWYQPGTGTFLSVDPIGNGSAYGYVGGNPVNLIDPLGYFGCDPITGECDYGYGLCVVQGQGWRGAYVNGKPCIVEPNNVQTGGPAPLSSPPSSSPISPIQDDTIHDDRDLTSWMFRELKEALRTPAIGFIKQLYEDDPGGVLYGKYTAGIYWRALVRDKARYDFKHEIRRQMGETILFMSNENGQLWNEYSLPGNVFFGYVGSHIGFPGVLTHAGAGWAEMGDPAHKDRRNICDIYYLPPDRIWTLGDDPLDYNMVQFGIDLWNKYSANLTEYQLRDELEQNLHKFAPPPELPGQGTTPNYGWQGNVYKEWPYEVGDFIGPRAAEFWPPRARSSLELNFD